MLIDTSFKILNLLSLAKDDCLKFEVKEYTWQRCPAVV